MNNKTIRAVTSGLAAFVLCGGAAIAWNEDPVTSVRASAVRDFIAQQVGGVGKLQVPALDTDLPLPRRADNTVNPRYKTTEEKRYLGKLLFHDPVRTARINVAYGGVLETRQTGSCGSCHFGEAASKAGDVFNFNVGGEGRGYTDENGKFVVRRRPRTGLLPQLRNNPLYPGDVLVDALPTLTDVYLVPPSPGQLQVTTPARGEKLPVPLQLVATGRLDALDSVARASPSLVGAAYNNRLLLGGFAGEPDSLPGGLNPYGDPAQENLTLLLLDAHRMLDSESAEIQNSRLLSNCFGMRFRRRLPRPMPPRTSTSSLTIRPSFGPRQPFFAQRSRGTLALIAFWPEKITL